MTEWVETGTWVNRSELPMAFLACNASCGCAYRVSEKKFVEVNECDDHTVTQALRGAADYIRNNTDMMCDIETSEEAVDYE